MARNIPRGPEEGSAPGTTQISSLLLSKVESRYQSSFGFFQRTFRSFKRKQRKRKGEMDFLRGLLQKKNSNGKRDDNNNNYRDSVSSSSSTSSFAGIDGNLFQYLPDELIEKILSYLGKVHLLLDIPSVCFLHAFSPIPPNRCF